MCCRHVIPQITESGGGSVVNSSSVVALQGQGLHAYSAAKGGVLSLTRALAGSYGAQGVRVNAICPGMILTDRSLYRKLFSNPELHAGEAYMNGTMRFEDGSLRDFLTLFSVNRRALGAYPLQHALRRVSRMFKRFHESTSISPAQPAIWSRPKPRAATPFVPRRRPLAIAGGFVSFGLRFRLVRIPVTSLAASSITPVTPRARSRMCARG